MFDLVVMSPFTRPLGATGGVQIYQPGQHITDAVEQDAVWASHRAFVVRIPSEPEKPSDEDAEVHDADEASPDPKSIEAA